MFSAEIDKFIVDDSDKNTLFAKVSSKEGKFANYTILFFIILSIFLIIFESLGNNRLNYFEEIFILDFLISSVFFLEYIYRFEKSKYKVGFLFRLTNIFDLLSFLPFFILLVFSGIGSYIFFSIFRVFRIFKIFELLNKTPLITRFIKGIYYRRLEFETGILVYCLLILFSSITVYYFEFYFGNKQNFVSIPDTIMWSFSALYTTGYGEMIPYTSVGKITGLFLTIIGPIIVAIFASITVLVFMESTRLIVLDKKIRAGIICSRCETLNSNDSIYCKKCGDLIDNLEVKK